jgi:AcrR family transcriptional regulator
MVVIRIDRKRGETLPRGPHRLTSSEVAADQCNRLTDAMVDLVGEQGYAITTVAELIKRAQVSRKTFYEHYEGREQLLLAAFDTTSVTALEQVSAASERGGGSTRRLEAAMRKLVRHSNDRPGALALWAIDIAAFDPTGLERRAALMAQYGQLIEHCLSSRKQDAKLPPFLPPILAGAVLRVIDSSLRGTHQRDTNAVALELARWVRSYHPAPPLPTAQAASVARTKASCNGTGHLGGRAPGTLALAPHNYVSLLGGSSPAQRSHLNRERILDAVSQLTSEQGYMALSAVGIADAADLPEYAFRVQFKNKDDAYATAVELGHTKAQAMIARTREQNPIWHDGVSTAIHGLLDFFSSEPLYTYMAVVSAPIAGAQMARRTYEHVSAYARLLFDGAPQRRRPPELAAEAIVQAIFELAFTYAVAGRAPQLTSAAEHAVYLALAPYLGVVEAAKAAAP